MQAKIMLFMPVIFTAMFINFPAGLMLYWFVNNSLSFLQQWYIMRTINAKDGKHKPKKLVRERA
jgi:YidC/Oxa1 family membrane protein insertase